MKSLSFINKAIDLRLPQLVKVCPVCSGEIIKDPDSLLGVEFYCPQTITLSNGKEFHHYYHSFGGASIAIYYLPFKILIYSGKAEIYHKNAKAKPSAYAQFKKILIVPPDKLPLNDGKALFNKLKTWTLFS